MGLSVEKGGDSHPCCWRAWRVASSVCSTVRFEESMTVAPSAILRGELLREESCWSRLATASDSPSLERRAARISSEALM